MSETLKKIPLITKFLYLLAIILLIAWVVPTIITYINNTNGYKEHHQEIQKASSRYAITAPTKEFSTKVFKEETKSLFSKVDIKELGQKKYEVHIQIKKEDLKKLKGFIETISLRYYVEIIQPLKLDAKEETINLKMTLKAL